MAKAKKSGGDQPDAAKKAAAKTTAKAATAPATPAAAKKPAMSPLIDTSLAAQSAARLLVAGISAKGGKASQSSKPESSLFKQLKSGLNKPHSTAMNSLLDKTHGPQAHKNQPFAKQVGHNQTVGSDATRTGVPRRTPG